EALLPGVDVRLVAFPFTRRKDAVVTRLLADAHLGLMLFRVLGAAPPTPARLRSFFRLGFRFGSGLRDRLPGDDVRLRSRLLFLVDGFLGRGRRADDRHRVRRL